MEEFLRRKNFVYDSCLGVGTQGSVFVFNIPSQNPVRLDQVAVKFHDREIAYDRELGVFLRLSDLQIEEVGGCMVPQLIGYDDDLLAIEMTIAARRFVSTSAVRTSIALLTTRPKFGRTGGT